MVTPLREHQLGLIKNHIPAHFYHTIVDLNKLPEEVERLKKRIQELENPFAFKFREHRGSLEDSLATERSVKNNSLEELIACVKASLSTYPVDVNADTLSVEHYCKDNRQVGYPETYIVSIKRYGVVGFTNYLPV